MYVETDATKHLIIQEIKVKEAELLARCIDLYFAGKKLQNRSPEENRIIALGDELKNLFKKKYP